MFLCFGHLLLPSSARAECSEQWTRPSFCLCCSPVLQKHPSSGCIVDQCRFIHRQFDTPHSWVAAMNLISMSLPPPGHSVLTFLLGGVRMHGFFCAGFFETAPTASDAPWQPSLSFARRFPEVFAMALSAPLCSFPMSLPFSGLFQQAVRLHSLNINLCCCLHQRAQLTALLLGGPLSFRDTDNGHSYRCKCHCANLSLHGRL